MSSSKRSFEEEHLAGLGDAFGDGGKTYGEEVEKRQRKPRSRRRVTTKTLTETISKLPKGTAVRSEDRDNVAERIRKAKTHEEKMAIAKKHHESVNNPDPYVFPKKWQREELANLNRTALKFKEEKTK